LEFLLPSGCHQVLPQEVFDGIFILLVNERISMSIKRGLLSVILVVVMGVLASCDVNNPAHIQAWYDLNPEQGENVTRETMNDEQRAVVEHLQEQQRAWFEAVASRPRDCYSAMEQVWPAHLWEWGRKVIWRESRNIPTAQNPSSSAAGCWQMLKMHDHRYYAVGCTPADKYDALCNSKAAWHLYRAAGGPSPWALTSY
jgi:hypothetical protein